MKCLRITRRFLALFPPAVLFSFVLSLFASCVTAGGISAEEYYSMATAFMDLGRYEEAERWFRRARLSRKTRAASDYNLGRIAFETGRYEEAADIFESILRSDPENVMVRKAAAYTRIKLADLEKAEAHYEKILALIPESADDGYNYALVLLAMEKPEQAESTLLSFPVAMLENKDAMLLYARILKAQHRVEAVNTYEKWLKNYTDPVVSFEYAEVLEEGELYARALEVVGGIIEADQTKLGKDLAKEEIRFLRARLLMIADSQSRDGINELSRLINSGYADIEKVQALTANEKISSSQKDEIRRLIGDMERKAQAEKETMAAEEPKEAQNAGNDDSSETDI